MAFNDLISTSFLFSVAIIIILIGGIFAYVSYRMSEQDHKITSMVGLISTMAEELQFFRSKLSQSQSQSQQGGLFKQEDTSDQIHTIPILDPNNLITGVTSLISVSDDEDDEDEESVSESESNTGSSSDSDPESDSDDEEYNLDEIVDLEDSVQMEEQIQISTIPIDETNNIKSIHLEESFDLNVFEHEIEHDHEHTDDLLASDLKTISITDFEDTNKKTDYKKLSINKLREVVIEKGIVADATKLKKNEILKLLGDE
jgi:hypothetical protein